jgi:hypothetical protein
MTEHPISRKTKVFDAENVCDYDYRGPNCTNIFNAEQKLCYNIEAKDVNFFFKMLWRVSYRKSSLFMNICPVSSFK